MIKRVEAEPEARTGLSGGINITRQIPSVDNINNRSSRSHSLIVIF